MRRLTRRAAARNHTLPDRHSLSGADIPFGESVRDDVLLLLQWLPLRLGRWRRRWLPLRLWLLWRLRWLPLRLGRWGLRRVAVAAEELLHRHLRYLLLLHRRLHLRLLLLHHRLWHRRVRHRRLRRVEWRWVEGHCSSSTASARGESGYTLCLEHVGKNVGLWRLRRLRRRRARRGQLLQRHPREDGVERWLRWKRRMRRRRFMMSMHR